MAVTREEMYLAYMGGGYATETGAGYRPLQGVTHVMFNVSTIHMDLQSLYC